MEVMTHMKMRLLTLLTVLTFVFAAGVTAQDTDNTLNSFQSGEQITLSGVANIVSPNAFVLTDTMVDSMTTMAEAGQNVIVFPAEDDDFDIDVNNGLPVQVTGDLMPFNTNDVETNLNLTLDENAFNTYDNNDWALMATTVQPLVNNTLMTNDMAMAIQNDPTAHFGEQVAVDGIAQIVSPNVFRLEDTAPFALDNDILVLPSEGGEFTVDVDSGDHLQVFGELTMYNLTDLENRVGYDLDDDALAAFDDADYAIIATSVGHWYDTTNFMDTAETDADMMDTTDTAIRDTTLDTDFADVDPYELLDRITDEPSNYYGAYVTVAGSLEDFVDSGSGGIVIVEEDLIGDDPVLVIPGTQGLFLDSPWAADDDVMVTGTVHQMVLTDIENEIGFDLDDLLYDDYDNMPVIVADSISVGTGYDGLF